MKELGESASGDVASLFLAVEEEEGVAATANTDDSGANSKHNNM